MSLGSAPLPTAPTPDQLAAMRTHLEHGVRHGDLHARKALFNALLDGLTVQDRDDIRPVFRLYDPAAVPVLETSPAP